LHYTVKLLKNQEVIEKLVFQMGQENIWGYKRIQGELKKLDITVSKSSVANILRRNGFGHGCLLVADRRLQK